MQFVKRVGRFVHLQPLAINRRLATRRMSYAPDAHAHTDGRTDGRTHLASLLLPLATYQGRHWKKARKTTTEGRGRNGWWAAMLAIFHAFNNRNVDAPLSWASIHLFIHSFTCPLARSPAHSCAQAFIHSLKYSPRQVAVRLLLVRYLLGAQWLKSSAFNVLEMCALQWAFDIYRLNNQFAEEAMICIDFWIL